MKNRRSFLQILTCAAVALVIVVVPTLADELIGRITKVDIDAKKIVVTEKGTDKDVDVTITDDTIFINNKGDEKKVNLERLQKGVEKSKKGMQVIVTHEKGVASKIQATAKKKAETKEKSEVK